MAGEKDDDRKGSVIHARVPAPLDEEIRRKASSLGLSVSNLVRNVLQNTFGLVDDIVNDSAAIARSARGGLTTVLPATAPRPGQVLGWQELILNLNAVCDGCNAILAKGTPAAVAVTDGGSPRPFLCKRCLKELTNGSK